MNLEDHKTRFNFNSNQPTGNGIFGSPAANTANGRPVTTLNVPVLSPTHFDDPIPHSQPVQPPQPTHPSPEELEKQALIQSTKRSKISSIIFGVLAFIFLGLSIWGLIFGIQISKELTQAKSLANSQAAIISAVEDSTGVTITTPDDVPTYQNPHGYIYLDDWKIKLKVPEDLVSVSYIYDQKYRPRICFNAVKKGVEHFPAFADVAQNPGGMGCLLRVEVSEGDTDQDGNNFGLRVFTDNKGYNYFYIAPTKTYAQDSAEQSLENSTIQTIKNMLSNNNISLYE